MQVGRTHLHRIRPPSTYELGSLLRMSSFPTIGSLLRMLELPYYRESTVHARASLQYASSTKLMSFVIMDLKREQKTL